MDNENNAKDRNKPIFIIQDVVWSTILNVTRTFLFYTRSIVSHYTDICSFFDDTVVEQTTLPEYIYNDDAVDVWHITSIH